MLIIMINGTASCLARTWFFWTQKQVQESEWGGGVGEWGQQAIQDNKINWDTGSHAHFNSFKPGILFVGHRQIAK